MSQRSVEKILGRLVTDASFRDQFFLDPKAGMEVGLELSSTERSALMRLDRRVLTVFAAVVDHRIRRSDDNSSRN